MDKKNLNFQNLSTIILIYIIFSLF